MSIFTVTLIACLPTSVGLYRFADVGDCKGSQGVALEEQMVYIFAGATIMVVGGVVVIVYGGRIVAQCILLLSFTTHEL